VPVGVGIFSVLAILVVVAYVIALRRRRAWRAAEGEAE